MSKKLILCLVAVFYLCSCRFVFADLVINEVQLLPTEGRFIELYNGGDESIDLTNWYIQRKTATGSSFGSLVSKTNFEGKTVNSHDYFVISKNSLSSSDIILNSLTLTESNTIQIKNSNGETVDSVSWESVPEGQSTQKTESNSWIIATPTPGAENKTEITPPPIDDGSGDSDSGGGGSGSGSSTFVSSGDEAEPKTKTVLQKIKAQITAKTLAYVGIPVKLEGIAFGTDGKQLFGGKYFWNFGDGDFRETKVINTDKFTHTYFYPGEYNVVFEHYPDSFADTPDASQKITIKVITPEVSISSVGNEKDFFVELLNNTDYEVDISNWSLVSEGKSFIIPRNTILAAKKKIIISPKVSNFSIEDKDTLKLMTPEREVAFDYSSPVVASEPTAIQPLTLPPSREPSNFSFPDKVKPGGINATALNSIAEPSTTTSPEENDFHTGLLFIISVIFIGISAGAVYFIRRKRIVSEPGADFEILDE